MAKRRYYQHHVDTYAQVLTVSDNPPLHNNILRSTGTTKSITNSEILHLPQQKANTVQTTTRRSPTPYTDRLKWSLVPTHPHTIQIHIHRLTPYRSLRKVPRQTRPARKHQKNTCALGPPTWGEPLRPSTRVHTARPTQLRSLPTHSRIRLPLPPTSASIPMDTPTPQYCI